MLRPELTLNSQAGQRAVLKFPPCGGGEWESLRYMLPPKAVQAVSRQEARALQTPRLTHHAAMVAADGRAARAERRGQSEALDATLDWQVLPKPPEQHRI
jgi:hypothetical protein